MNIQHVLVLLGIEVDPNQEMTLNYGGEVFKSILEFESVNNYVLWSSH